MERKRLWKEARNIGQTYGTQKEKCSGKSIEVTDGKYRDAKLIR
jgi:hypothetical protein